MFTAASDPFLFRLAVFALAIFVGWVSASRTVRGHRQAFVVIAGLVAAAISSGAILIVGGSPAGAARSLSFVALLIAARRISTGKRRVG